MDIVEPFEIEGLTPKEVIEKISATILALTHDAVAFGHRMAKEDADEVYTDGYKDGYDEGHKDGMTEAVTRITE